MRVPRILAAVAATTLGLGLLTAPSASAHQRAGTTSLAEVLAADGSGYDRNPYDFDILEHAVTAVLTAKPDSAVAVLADGNTRLTAFLPTDAAFRTLVADLTGTHPRSERAVFEAVASLGIDTVETVLLYHVVPGATITYRTALGADHAKLTTAQGGTIRVNVVDRHWIRLGDQDPDARNALVVWPNINKGNKQIAHAVNRVLRPVDL